MKKLTIALLSLLALTLTGCKKATPEERQQIRERLQKIDEANFRDDLHTIEYNGHSYIIYEGRYKGGITHDPDCPCQKKGIHITTHEAQSINNAEQ